MRKSTEDSPRGIRWTLSSKLEDLDFADDLALLAHTHQHIKKRQTDFVNLEDKYDYVSTQRKQKP